MIIESIPVAADDNCGYYSSAYVDTLHKVSLKDLCSIIRHVSVDLLLSQ